MIGQSLSITLLLPTLRARLSIISQPRRPILTPTLIYHIPAVLTDDVVTDDALRLLRYFLALHAGDSGAAT